MKLVKGNNDSGIVNPFAKTVLTVTMDDQMQVRVQTDLPPDVVVKSLTNLAIGIIFEHAETLAAAAQLGKLKIQEQPLIQS